MQKTVLHLLPAQQVDMGGIFVKQALPTLRVEQVDPYLLLHHGTFTFEQGGKALQLGIGPHPHRGFSPVTFVIEGELHHRDSFGHSQIARSGDLQWMDAGAGIVHSERPSQELVDRGGRQEVVQIWINTHSSRKMQPPRYLYLPGEEMPETSPEPGRCQMKLVAAPTPPSPARNLDKLDIRWGKWTAEFTYTWKLDEGMNAMVYVLRGELRVPAYGKVNAENLLVFSSECTDIVLTGSEGTQCLLLAGDPLREKMVAQGPFVMNTETQILEAMRDYQMGKMGILIEE